MGLALRDAVVMLCRAADGYAYAVMAAIGGFLFGFGTYIPLPPPALPPAQNDMFRAGVGIGVGVWVGGWVGVGLGLA